MGAHVELFWERSVPAGLDAGMAASLDHDPVAAPFREGARARAIADLCERSGLPALMIERTGQVLVANRGAQSHLGTLLRLEAGRLGSSQRQADKVVRALIDSALNASGAAERHAVTIRSRESSLTLLAFPYRNDSPYQLVKAVIVVTNQESAVAEALDALADHLSGA